jgi:hypothetical protein
MLTTLREPFKENVSRNKKSFQTSHQEYKSAQVTLNIIVDYNRETYKNILQEEYESDIN